MNKIYISMVAFILGSVSAIAQSFTIVDDSQLNITGVEFTTSKDGLILSAILPSTAKSVEEIELTMELVNNTNKEFSFHELEGTLEGMRFTLQDSSGHFLPMTENGKREMTSRFSLAGHFENLAVNQAMVIVVPIKNYIIITDFGKYKISLTWGEDKIGDDPFGVPRPPTLQLSGSFLLQNSGNGVSISETK